MKESKEDKEIAKMNMKELKRKQADALTAGEAAREAARKCKEEIAKLEEMRLAAAESGDENLYKKATDRIAEMESKIYFYEKRAEKLGEGGVTPEEVHEAWDDYVAGYSKELAAKQKDYLAAIKAAAKAYKAMLELQSAAMKEKLFCGELCGIQDPGKYGGRESAYSEFEMPTIDLLHEGAPVSTQSVAGAIKSRSFDANIVVFEKYGFMSEEEINNALNTLYFRV